MSAVRTPHTRQIMAPTNSRPWLDKVYLVYFVLHIPILFCKSALKPPSVRVRSFEARGIHSPH